MNQPQLLVDPTNLGNILNFGAQARVTDVAAEFNNCWAFGNATYAANSGQFGDDRRVLIPAGEKFHFMPGCHTENLNDIVI